MRANKPTGPGRSEFGRSHNVKKAPRASRRAPPRRLIESSDSAAAAATHGDEPAIEREIQPPREDRAG